MAKKKSPESELEGFISKYTKAVAAEGRAALAKLRCAPLLAGFRGRPAADVDALADLVVRLSDAAIAHGSDIVEVELNPVLVGQHGATAVDALLLIEPATEVGT